MNHTEKYSDGELLEMQEIATNFIWHVKPNNILKGIIEIALIEINRELDERKIKKGNSKNDGQIKSIEFEVYE